MVLGRMARMSHMRIVLSCEPVITCRPCNSSISLQYKPSGPGGTAAADGILIGEALWCHAFPRADNSYTV